MMILAARAAGLAHFLIGGLWHSPLVFSDIWMRGPGLTEIDTKATSDSYCVGVGAIPTVKAGYSCCGRAG